jgi:hypothetical protein
MRQVEKGCAATATEVVRPRGRLPNKRQPVVPCFRQQLPAILPQPFSSLFIHWTGPLSTVHLPRRQCSSTKHYGSLVTDLSVRLPCHSYLGTVYNS